MARGLECKLAWVTAASYCVCLWGYWLKCLFCLVLFASSLNLAKCLSILLIFSINQLLVLLNFLLFFYS